MSDRLVRAISKDGMVKAVAVLEKTNLPIFRVALL